ncbi:MAG: alkaline phosphatase [Planctomycetaceae bacterium]
MCTRFVVVLILSSVGLPFRAAAAQGAADGTPRPGDRFATLQWHAEADGGADWGFWGDQPDRYVSWSNHSNRLIPVYSFGMTLATVGGVNSVYRDAARLTALYGRMPEETLDPAADHFDQTDVFHLQSTAVAGGATRVVLFVFDGMDWTLTRAAAIAATGTVAYDAGRGAGLAFQDYAGTVTDFGLCVTSPANDGTKTDVDAQAVTNPGGTTPGGYAVARGGRAPWDPAANPTYLIGKDRDRPHAVTDSAASATSLCTGRKTYNDAINVDPTGVRIDTIAHVLQRRGYAVGVVTSVPIPHATPGCAYAHNVSRDDYQDISRDLLGERSVSHRDAALPGLDVVIGCGFGVDLKPAEMEKETQQQGSNLEAGNKYVAASTLAAIDATNGGRYRVARRTAGRDGSEVLAAVARECIADGKRLCGFFGTAEGNLPFATADGNYDPVFLPDADRERLEGLKRKYSKPIRYTAADIVENPTLAEMTVAALDVLSARGPFWLLVEAGDVDWAAHGNNLDGAIGAALSGDAAFRALTGWIETHGGWRDTVVIVTSDHGHMFVLTRPEALTAR